MRRADAIENSEGLQLMQELLRDFDRSELSEMWMEDVSDEHILRQALYLVECYLDDLETEEDGEARKNILERIRELARIGSEMQ